MQNHQLSTHYHNFATFSFLLRNCLGIKIVVLSFTFRIFVFAIVSCVKNFTVTLSIGSEGIFLDLK